MKKLFSAIFIFAALAFSPSLAQVTLSCPVGFPGTPLSDCVTTWETPSAEAPNIALFQMRADGAGTPVAIGLPPKTTNAGVDRWTLPLPVAFRTLPAGSHTVQVRPCPPGTAPCAEPFTPASNAFLSGVLTTPRNLLITQ